MSFVVRWSTTHDFLGDMASPSGAWRHNVRSFKEAFQFESIAAARAAIAAKHSSFHSLLDIIEVTWGIKWKTIRRGETIREYSYYARFEHGLYRWRELQCHRERFATRAAACAEIDSLNMFKFATVNEVSEYAYGVVVVRFMKKVG